MSKVLVDRKLLELIERTWRAKLTPEHGEGNVLHGLLRLRAILAQPAEAEGVEVLGHRIYWPTIGREPAKARTVDPAEYADKKPVFHTCVEDLMAVSQHQRILSAVTAERDVLRAALSAKEGEK